MSSNKYCNIHIAFPKKIGVVIEQPPNEKYRLIYNSQNDRFYKTNVVSMLYKHGYSGAYGWVCGLGSPPQKHCDAYLLTTNKSIPPGAVIEGNVCGVFFKGNSDDKVIVYDDTVSTMSNIDLLELDPTLVCELKRLYQRLKNGQRWGGRWEAIKYLEEYAKSYF